MGRDAVPRRREESGREYRARGTKETGILMEGGNEELFYG